MEPSLNPPKLPEKLGEAKEGPPFPSCTIKSLRYAAAHLRWATLEGFGDSPGGFQSHGGIIREGMRLAITTDWLVASGGAERVIAEMHTLWPEAPIFTTVLGEECPGRFTPSIRTPPLERGYRLLRTHRALLPWMPRAVESWDLRGFDVILSSSHAVAKGCIPPSTARHICYCHTPMRYIWEMEERYLDDLRLSGPLRSFVKWQFKKIRQWDLTTAKRVDLFIANSLVTEERIRRVYNRESIVLHPPVDDRFFHVPLQTSKPENQQTPYFLAVGRLVPYKRFDLLLETANKLSLPLQIAGVGPDFARLQQQAGPTVQFLGYVPEEELPELYRNATALLFPVEEDAGIAPLEAQACGTPVIAFKKGGVLDTVKEGETGTFFTKQTVAALSEALERFREMRFEGARIRDHARQFSSEQFRGKLREVVEQESKK